MAIESQILQIIDEVNDLRDTRDDAWQVPRVEGELLYHIAVSARAKVIVELGTSYGFSGLFWAAALRHTGGKLHTIDISQKKYDASRDHFRRAGLADVVVNHLGDAFEVVPTIRETIDIAFIDAVDKKSSQRYFELLWPSVRPGGSILTDNATTHREELVDFVRWVRARPDASGVEIPVGNGLEWTVKLP